MKDCRDAYLRLSWQDVLGKRGNLVGILLPSLPRHSPLRLQQSGKQYAGSHLVGFRQGVGHRQVASHRGVAA